MKQCSIENCKNKYEAKGYCSKHYQKWRTFGDPLHGREKHGLRHVSGYKSWEHMISRCKNPNHPKWHRYGGRGIKVCERWKKFVNFYEDMGERPGPEYSIERIDNDGDYGPDNCKWANPKEQANNTSRNVFITHKGITLTRSQWARKQNIPIKRVEDRVRNGWTEYRALELD